MAGYGSWEDRPWERGEGGMDEDRWRREREQGGRREMGRWGERDEERLGRRGREEWRSDTDPSRREAFRPEWRSEDRGYGGRDPAQESWRGGGSEGERGGYGDRWGAQGGGERWGTERGEERLGSRGGERWGSPRGTGERDRGFGTYTAGQRGSAEYRGGWRDEDRGGWRDEGRERWSQDRPWVERGPEHRGRETSRGMVEWEDRGPLKWLGDKIRGATGRPARGPKGYARSDERIQEDVCERIARSGAAADDVEVKVENREVTLTGTVRNRDDKWWLETVADDVFGVEEVHNHLRVSRGETGRGTTTGTEEHKLPH